MDRPQPHIDLVIDDEHPWFDALFGNAKAQRCHDVTATKPPPPAPPEMTVTMAGVVHRFSLENIGELCWAQARAYMRTRWRPTGQHAPIQPADETPTATQQRKADTK